MGFFNSCALVGHVETGSICGVLGTGGVFVSGGSGFSGGLYAGCLLYTSPSPRD